MLEPTSLFATDFLLTTPPALQRALGTIYSGQTSIINFSVSLPLTLSTEPFSGALVPPVGGGGTSGGGSTSGGGGTEPLTIDPSACVGVLDSEARLLCLVNDVRNRSGLSMLSIDSALDIAAGLHALDMYENQYLGYTGSDGSDFFTRALDAGYDGSFLLGELLGSGFSLADTLVQAWLDSESHRDVLLNQLVNEAGIGYVEGNNTRYWDLFLGRAPEMSVPLPGTLPLLGIALGILAIVRRNISY